MLTYLRLGVMLSVNIDRIEQYAPLFVRGKYILAMLRSSEGCN